MSRRVEEASRTPELAWRGGPWLLGLALAVPWALVIRAGLGTAVPTWALLLALTGLLTVVGVGVAAPQTGLFARPVLGCTTSESVVALTFDDGPHPVHTPQILDLLDRHGQRATFFVIGHKASAHPDLVAEIVRRGHELGNHSWRHVPWTPALPARMLARELRESSELLQKIAGVAPRWFRPPVGLVSPPVALASAMTGQRLVIWTATARDGVARAQADVALARLRKDLRPGAILVLHDGVDGPADRSHAVLVVLPQLLESMSESGMRSVTLSELLPT